MKVDIKNYSSVPQEKVQRLYEELERLPVESEDPGRIEIHDYPHSRKDSDGEVVGWFGRGRKIIIYKRAFEGQWETTMHIVLHELGHYFDRKVHPIFCLFIPFLQKWREKRADAFAARFGYGH
jgi:Zn-dependent protease with chaperone function